MTNPIHQGEVRVGRSRAWAGFVPGTGSDAPAAQTCVIDWFSTAAIGGCCSSCQGWVAATLSFLCCGLRNIRALLDPHVAPTYM